MNRGDRHWVGQPAAQVRRCRDRGQYYRYGKLPSNALPANELDTAKIVADRESRNLIRLGLINWKTKGFSLVFGRLLKGNLRHLLSFKSKTASRRPNSLGCLCNGPRRSEAQAALAGSLTLRARSTGYQGHPRRTYSFSKALFTRSFTVAWSSMLMHLFRTAIIKSVLVAYQSRLETPVLASPPFRQCFGAGFKKRKNLSAGFQ
ncbi:MAG: hypothetical protein ABSF90_12545 [Syntrophobacteraceae bacterium]